MIDLNDTRIPAEVREKIKNAPVKERIDNTAALAESGLHVVHCNTSAIYAGERFRAVTVAFQQINKSHVKIATAVVHRSDTFEKKVGTKIALANFKKGNTIVIPLAGGSKTADIPHQLRQMFGYIGA